MNQRHDRDRWTDDPVIVFVMIAAAIVLGVVVWKGIETYQLKLVTDSLQETMQRAERSVGSVQVPTIKRAHIETEHIPGQSVADCKRLTGGEINEEFARCRRGYTQQTTVYR